MKLFFSTTTLIAMLTPMLISMAPTRAFAGGGSPGGGDVQCDAAIRSDVDALKDWFQGGGPQVDSQLDLSSSRNPRTGRPYTKQEYTSAMTKILALPLRSSCRHQGLAIGKAHKICKTQLSQGVVDMACDAGTFLQMQRDDLKNQDLEIQQIHHEFAILIPGLEPDAASLPNLAPNTIDLSSYKISSQLAAVTITKEVRMVAVIDPASPLNGKACDAIVMLTALRANRFLGDDLNFQINQQGLAKMEEVPKDESNEDYNRPSPVQADPKVIATFAKFKSPDNQTYFVQVNPAKVAVLEKQCQDINQAAIAAQFRNSIQSMYCSIASAYFELKKPTDESTRSRVGKAINNAVSYTNDAPDVPVGVNDSELAGYIRSAQDNLEKSWVFEIDKPTLSSAVNHALVRSVQVAKQNGVKLHRCDLN